MAPPPLRTLLVGLGRIGFGFHGPALRQQPGYQLAGVVDPLAGRRAEAASAWSVPAFADLGPALAALRPDLVVIASPTPFHAGQAREALAAGAHVFCDKPVATSLEEFDAVLAAARTAGRRFAAYQPARFRPEVRFLRGLLARGVLGPVHLVRRSRCDYVRRHDWQAHREHGGGLLNNYGSHCLDEILALFGAAAVAPVGCQLRTVASAGDAEDVVSAQLRADDGCLVELHISQAAALSGPAWEIHGRHGAALYDAPARTWRWRYYDPARAPRLQGANDLAAAGRRYNSEQLPWTEETATLAASDEFDYYGELLPALLGTQPAPVTPEDSRRLVALIETCRAAAGAPPPFRCSPPTTTS